MDLLTAEIAIAAGGVAVGVALGRLLLAGLLTLVARLTHGQG